MFCATNVFMHSASSVLPPISHFRRKSNTRKMRFLPRDGGRRSISLSRERDDRDAVEVREADVGQRGADLHRVVELGQRRADRHRVRDVDQDVDVEILFLLEQAQQQLVEAAVEVPVDVAEVVAARVGAVIGELDAASRPCGCGARRAGSPRTPCARPCGGTRASSGTSRRRAPSGRPRGSPSARPLERLERACDARPDH